MHLNLIMYVLSHALSPTGRYSVLSFRISTVFDVNPLELVRFRNSRYFVSSCSFSCPVLPFLLSFSYFKCKIRKQFRSFSTVSDRSHPYSCAVLSPLGPTSVVHCQQCGHGFEKNKTMDTETRELNDCSAPV
jgi:hypothetical protein